MRIVAPEEKSDLVRLDTLEPGTVIKFDLYNAARTGLVLQKPKEPLYGARWPRIDVTVVDLKTNHLVWLPRGLYVRELPGATLFLEDPRRGYNPAGFRADVRDRFI